MKTTMILIAVLLAGCATTSTLNRLSPGMTKAEVVEVMGNPDSTASDGQVEYLRYRRLKPFHGWHDYFVRITEGRVDAYGRVGDFGTSDPTVNVRMR